ncbi:MAG: glycosyltransferase [Planctomycetota bacterium]
MRIVLVSHGFPPLERTGVENYTASLAAELARQGHGVEVFTPRVREDLPQLSLRREERDGYGVNWISTNQPPRDPSEALDLPGVAQRFGELLDRERPDVVHFQHFVKLGVGMVFEARKRSVPTAYTAHDYYAVCHRYTLLRPDLSRCELVGDSMACARCDLGLAFLNQQEGLGDYQMGVLPEQLSEEQRDALGELLDDGEPVAAGMSYEDLDAAFDERQVLDGRRAEAYTALDRILAPTEFLAAQLRQGGVDPDSIAVLPYGIDTDAVRDVEPILAGERLRFGFLSGMSKHKGAHVLIEAFGRLQEPAELVLFGGSTDAVHVERMREQASEVGAVWGGAFDREDLPRNLSAVDVVVVPSIWYENQPIVILEALAAGRPVVVPRVGTFPENVRDGVDGLLYEPDDPASLAAALTRLVREDGLVEKLAEGVRARTVPDVATQVGQLLEIYTELCTAREQAADDDLVPSMRSFVARYREHRERPTRELFARALRGLGALREGLGDAAPALSGEELLLAALGSGSKVQEDLRDQRRETQWMQDTLSAEEQEVGWMRGVLEEREIAIGALSEERDWLKGIVEGQETELSWLRELKESLEADVQLLRSELDHIAGVGAMLGEHLRNTAELGLSALEAQQHVLGEEVKPLLDVLQRVVGGEIEAKEKGMQDTQVLNALVGGVRLGVLRLQAIESELAWRREQMGAAEAEAGRAPARIVLKRTGLGRRVRSWNGSPWPGREHAE